jgi:adenylate kinase
MNIVMFGPPGAGKGSVSAPITKEFSYPHIAAGDIVRAEAKKQNNKVEAFMKKGELVPDKVIMELVHERLSQKDCKKGFILDGFPRTIAQAEFLEEKNIHIDAVISLEVDEEEIVRRLSGRMMDPKTGQIYNIFTMKLPKGVKKEDLTQRPDDKPEVIRNRLKVYNEQTAPVMQFYKKKNVVFDVDANPELDQVVMQVRNVLKDKRK